MFLYLLIVLLFGLALIHIEAILKVFKDFRWWKTKVLNNAVVTYNLELQFFIVHTRKGSTVLLCQSANGLPNMAHSFFAPATQPERAVELGVSIVQNLYPGSKVAITRTKYVNRI